MVSVRDRIFLVAGFDFLHRQRAIDNIKKKILARRNAALNILTFYSKEINIVELKDKLFNLSFDGEKIVIFKGFDGLSQPVREFLFNNFNKIIATNYIVLEAEKDLFQLQRGKSLSSDKFFNVASSPSS